MNGGKWVCLLFVYVVCEVFGGVLQCVDVVVCVVELIYVYLLVYDDLLVMDDDDLCCGQLIIYWVFDEVIVIFVVDGLQVLVFEVFVDIWCNLQEYVVCLEMFICLVCVVGFVGMVGGQVIDFGLVGVVFDQVVLEVMYWYKIGVLIEVSVCFGVFVSGCVEFVVLVVLECYVEVIGLVFQVQDDIFDVESDIVIFGKIQGKDQVYNKLIYFVLFGLEVVKGYVLELCDLVLVVFDGFLLSVDLLC